MPVNVRVEATLLAPPPATVNTMVVAVGVAVTATPAPPPRLTPVPLAGAIVAVTEFTVVSKAKLAGAVMVMVDVASHSPATPSRMAGLVVRGSNVESVTLSESTAKAPSVVTESA